MQFQFPANDLDRSANLLAALGSFWSRTYQGRDQVQSYCAARAEAEKQTLNDMEELVLSFSRLTTPIYHRDRWYRVILRKSMQNASLLSLLHYDQVPLAISDPNQPPITIPATPCAGPAAPQTLVPSTYAPLPSFSLTIAEYNRGHINGSGSSEVYSPDDEATESSTTPNDSWLTITQTQAGGNPVSAPVLQQVIPAQYGTPENGFGAGCFSAGTFYYKVTAITGSGETAGSNEDFTAVTTGEAITIQWLVVTGATGYRIYRGTASGAENVLVNQINAVSTIYTDSNINPTGGSPPGVNSAGISPPVLALSGTGLSTSGGLPYPGTFYYKVTAVNGSGETTGSNEVSVTTTSGNEAASLLVNPVVGATSYKVYRGTTAGGENTLLGSFTASAPLLPSNQYYFLDGGDQPQAGFPPGSGSALTDARQQLTQNGFGPHTIFTLTYLDSGSAPHTTPSITYNAATNMAATIQAALNTLVSSGFQVTGGNTSPWTVEFVGSLGGSSQHLLRMTILQDEDDFHTVYFPGGGSNEVQLIWATGIESGDEFALIFNGHTTSPISYTTGSGTAPVIAAALTALSNIGASNVTVTGDGTHAAPWAVTFVNALGNAPQSLLQSSIPGQSGGGGGSGDPTPSFQAEPALSAIPGIASNIPAFNGGYHYDLSLQTPLTSYPTPPLLADAPLLFNRLTSPSLSWCEGVDYVLDLPNAAIIFLNDPFNDPRVATRMLFDENGNQVDQEATLWMFQADFDWDYVYRQFGYVLGVQLQSSEFYRDFVNRMFDALVGGTSELTIQQAVAAITGIPLVVEPTETVQTIDQDTQHQLVITDQHSYKFPLGVNVVVAAGQVLHAGDPLVDVVQFYEFRHGEVPSDLNAMAVGPGLLAYGYFNELIFQNITVPLEVDTEHPSGYTYLSWSLGGFPLDVQKFFDDLHANGVAANQTLAMLLDTRQNKVGQPIAMNLPTTINPLGFLLQNVLRNNAWVVRIKTSQLGSNNLGIYNLRHLRRVLPSSSTLIVILEMSLPPTEVRACLVGKTLVSFSGGALPAVQVGTELVKRKLSAKLVTGTCQ